jgi:LAS superfamily LD-carboxypeptidase LdcB
MKNIFPNHKNLLRKLGVLSFVILLSFSVIFGQNDATENKETEKIKVDFKQSALQNAQLKNNLKWKFGGKDQTGWYLYVYLIQHLLDTKESPDTEKFAKHLAKWQKKSELEPNGILDEKTLFKIIGFWQSQRLNRSDYPTEEELITAPIADFYDPTRAVELLKVKRTAYDAFKKMVAAAIKDKSLKLKVDKQGNLTAEEKMLKIVSAFRSREYQEKLRQQSPNSGRAGLAQNSPHFTGCALDIYVGGEPVTTRDDNRAIQIETRVYKWLVKNAEKFGFYPYFYEPWHWEYAPKNVKN